MRCALSVACISLFTELIVLWCGSVSSALVNVTVDDQGSDPTSKYGISYKPQWIAGQTCSGCEAHPDLNQAHGGTWRDITYDPSNPNNATPQNATFDFTGSAIYIYGIQSQSTTDPVSQADIVFYIDGTRVGNYQYAPSQASDGYTYNQLLFKTEGLVQASHVLGIQNGQIGGPISLILLDYLIYSTDDSGGASVPVVSLAGGISSAPTASASGSVEATSTTDAAPMPTSSASASDNGHGLSSTARTAIAAIAAALGVLLLSVLVWWMRRRGRQASCSTFVQIEAPFHTTNILPQTTNIYTAVHVIASAHSDPAPSYVSVCPPPGSAPPVLSAPLEEKEGQAGPSTSHLTLEKALPAVSLEPFAYGLHNQAHPLFDVTSIAPEATPPVHESEDMIQISDMLGKTV